jgi:hypothetical protein
LVPLFEQRCKARLQASDIDKEVAYRRKAPPHCGNGLTDRAHHLPRCTLNGEHWRAAREEEEETVQGK